MLKTNIIKEINTETTLVENFNYLMLQGIFIFRLFLFIFLNLFILFINKQIKTMNFKAGNNLRILEQNEKGNNLKFLSVNQTQNPVNYYLLYKILNNKKFTHD